MVTMLMAKVAATAPHCMRTKKIGKATRLVCQMIPTTTLIQSRLKFRLGTKSGFSAWTSLRMGPQNPHGRTSR